MRSGVNQWGGVPFQALKDRPETFLPCFGEAARQALAGCYARLPEKLAASRRGAPEFEPA